MVRVLRVTSSRVRAQRLKQTRYGMPDTRSHRGPHPKDEALFAPGQRARLREAVVDLSWLLSRGYAENSALKLVGDRHRLRRRQRTAIMRAACSDRARRDRKRRQQTLDACAERPVAIDGYNVLITVESALAGAYVFAGRDGCYRDLASMHGTFKRVEETQSAARLIGTLLEERCACDVTWYLDRPVHNSGRLASLLRDVFDEAGWPCTVECVEDVDALLASGDALVATSDSWILDRADRWINLARAVIHHQVPDCTLVRLDGALP